MEPNANKCVMVIDEALPLGMIANTAGIMGLTLGKHMPETIGPEVLDKSGCSHLGIIQIPVPVLKADREKIKELRQRLYEPEFAALTVVDFSDVAQSCNTSGRRLWRRKAAFNTSESEFAERKSL